MNPAPNHQLIQTLQQLHKRHLAFLSKFTSEMVQYFAAMKNYYQEQQSRRKLLFDQQKQQISQLVLEKKLQKQKNDEKISKKLAKKQKSQRKKHQKLIQQKLNAPKAPNTPYFMFFMDYKEKIKEDFPDISVVEAAKMAGKLWKELQDNEKEVYYQMHEDSKKKYQIEVEDYKVRKQKYEIEQAEKKRWQELMKGIEKEKQQAVKEKQKEFKKDQKKDQKKENKETNDNKGELQSYEQKQGMDKLENKQKQQDSGQKQVDLSLSGSESQSQIGKPIKKDQLEEKSQVTEFLLAQQETVDILKKLRDQSKAMMEETRQRVVQMAQLNQSNSKPKATQITQSITESGTDESPFQHKNPLKPFETITQFNQAPSDTPSQDSRGFEQNSISI